MATGASATADPLIGREVAGKYRIESCVGIGAMGTVYRARQLTLDKAIALKILRRDLEETGQFVDRFRVEAKAASKLDHPNSTRVIDFGREPDGLLYIAMELLDGRSLYDIVGEQWPLPEERVVRIMTQALAAIAAAHDMGVLHRDLKPENIVILQQVDDEGNATDLIKVCDFGIAKLAGGEMAPGGARLPAVALPPGRTRRLTHAGMVIGTPAYMSPEQASCGELDARSDVYSLGVILFELLTGRLPFDDPAPDVLARMHLTVEPPHPRDVNPNVSPALAAVCLKALQKDPAKRYAGAREMRNDLRLALASPVATPPREEAPAAGVSAYRLTDPVPSMPTLVPDAPEPPARRLAPVAALFTTALAACVFVLARTAHPDVPPRGMSDEPGVVQLAASTATAADTIDGPVLAGPIAASDDARGVMVAIAPIAPSPAPIEGASVSTESAVRALVAVDRPPQRHGPRAAPLAAYTPAAPAVELAPPAPSSAAREVSVPASPPAAPEPPPAPPIAAAAVTSHPAPRAPVAPPQAAPAFDPGKARLDVLQVQVDHVSPRDVNAVLARADLGACFVAAARAERTPHPSAVTLVLDIDDLRVARASISPGTASPVLRRCVESRVVGGRMPSADTGAATARITLTFAEP